MKIISAKRKTNTLVFYVQNNAIKIYVRSGFYKNGLREYRSIRKRAIFLDHFNTQYSIVGGNAWFDIHQ